MRDKPALEGSTPIRRQPLPFHRPSLGLAEENAVLEVLRSGWLARGARTAELEERLAEYTGAGQVLALNSCTAALELALILAGVQQGDEVIVPTLTFAATANVVVHLGARPVLVDVEQDTLNIDPEAVAAAITSRTRAIMAVDFAGHPAEYDDLNAVAAGSGLPLVRDAAHSLESRYRERRVGEDTPFTCLSFYANKNMTTGEGGALLARTSGDLPERAAALSLHGMSRHAWQRYGAGGFNHYDITEAGHKWNMFDLQAALGLVQLARVDEWLPRREEIVQRYRCELEGHAAVEIPTIRPHVRMAHHLFMVSLVPGALRVDRDHVLNAMQAEGIGVAVHYRALHQHTFYREHFGYEEKNFPVATRAANHLISLPLFPGMTDRDAGDVITALNRILTYYAA